MYKFIIKRIAYGLLVLAGVVTVVFFLFNVLPGDPARMMLGQRADQTSIEAINKDLGLNESLPVQYFLYVNDLMPLSIHSKNEGSMLYLNPDKYTAQKLFSLGNEFIFVAKIPYLRRSYQSQKRSMKLLERRCLKLLF